jgi:hypothetical protein
VRSILFFLNRKIEGEILLGEFSPRRHLLVGYDVEVLAGKLADWESQLPHEMRVTPPDNSLGAPFWAAMLQASYKYVSKTMFCLDPESY